jgi:hypothetical protein
MPYLSGSERYIAYKPTEKPTETPTDIRVCALWIFAKKNEEHRVTTLLSFSIISDGMGDFCYFSPSRSSTNPGPWLGRGAPCM